MNSASVFPTSNKIANGFPSLVALRDVHSDLLKQYRQDQESGLPLTAQLLSDIEAFIRRGQATGALLDSEDERWAAQSLLDYWIAILYRSGFEPPEATLADFDSSLAPELDDSLCPYFGLEAFREKDRQFFYGRQRLLDQLLQKFRESRLLAVVGSSGSGKSSVVLGGLIPSLKAGKLPGSENWHYYGSMVPGSNPLENLARLFCPKDVEENAWVKQQTEQLLGNPNHLTQLLSHEDGQPSVLVIDQFEEMFTLCLDEAKRHAFIKDILAVIESPEISHRIVLTMRGDFESWVAKISNFYPSFEKAKVYVTPLDAGELREAIEKPAELVGLKFEEGLVDKLIQDVLGEPAALPLLQFTLLKLWDSRERNRITQEAYQKVGGGRLALSNSADEFYNKLIPQDQVTCKRIFLKMVRPTEGLEVTSSRIPVKELYRTEVDRVNTEKVLNKLIEARLVKISQGDSSKDNQVEVAHEALIRNWHKLVEWLEDERVSLRQRLRLKAAAEQWEEQGRDNSALLRGALLEEARQYDDLTDLETQFVSSSIEYEKNKLNEKIKLRQRITWGSILAACLCLVFAGVAIYKWQQAELEKQVAVKAREQAELATKEAELNLQKYQQQQTQTQAAQAKLERANKELSQANPLQEQIASENERNGFIALLAGNLPAARIYFGEAYKAFPTYHNVYEIYTRVLTSTIIEKYNQPNEDQKSQELSRILGQILTKYFWTIPSDIHKEMKIKFLSNYQIGIYYYYNQGDADILKNAQEIQNSLIEYGLSEQKNCSSPVTEGGVCSPKSKHSQWFQGKFAGNTIRYDEKTEYEVALVLQKVLAEVYPQKKFRLQTVTTPTPKSISIFLN